MVKYVSGTSRYCIRETCELFEQRNTGCWIMKQSKREERLRKMMKEK